MRLSYKFPLNLVLHNRMFAKNALDSKTLTIEVIANRASTKDTFNMSLFEKLGSNVQELVHRAAVVSVKDPYLARLIEPKSGNTVHNYLDELKKEVEENEPHFKILGKTMPPDTINGYTVLVFGSEIPVTMEGVAEFVLRFASDIDEVVVSTDTMSAALKREDIDNN